MEKINFLIVGKPNSGKSTFYNTLNNKYLSPTGPESGLTKDILKRNDLQIEDDLKLIGKRALDSMSFAKANNMSVLNAIDGLLI